MKGFDLHSYQADAARDEAAISIIVLGCFPYLCKKQYPVHIVLYRENWDHISAKKPSEMIELATIEGVLCFNPQVIPIVFRPTSHDQAHESTIEHHAIALFQELGYAYGSNISPDGEDKGYEGFRESLLFGPTTG